jgi:hypothetical protein
LLAVAKDLRFGNWVTLVEAFDIRLARVSCHHIFEHPDVLELVNLQTHKARLRLPGAAVLGFGIIT